MGRHRTLLTLAALGCFGVSVLHILLSFGGAEINRFFGAPPEIDKLRAEGDPVFLVMSLGVTVLFLVFGLYALSGAGRIRHLPLVKSVLGFLGVIMTLRGLFVVITLQHMLKDNNFSQWQFLAISLAALLQGIVTLWGVVELAMIERRERLAFKTAH